MTQYRNRKTECPYCRQMVGNSGYKNHVAACEKKHKAIDAEYKEIQNRDEEAQEPTQIQTQTEQPPAQTQTDEEPEEDDEMTETMPEQVIIVHAGNPKKGTAENTEETAFDRFFDAAGRFLDKHGEVAAAALAPFAAAVYELSKPAPQPSQPPAITGEEW